jgi:hypothetical protein|tara:strand:+ start:80 stop:331 length:252 start_codon:yes stop_codon:yes gene_type:complete
MPKMRKFHFWNDKGDEKDTEQLSLTRAVKAVQSDFKDMFIGVEYISKKGKEVVDRIKLPWGRKVRQAIATEKKRAEMKARQQR